MLPYLIEDYFIACDYRLYFKKWEGEYDYIYKKQENQKKKKKKKWQQRGSNPVWLNG